MFTNNDILFSILHSCENGLESNRLIYYMYISQLAGLSFNFKYRVNASGLSCRPLNDYIGNVVNNDYIKVDNGVIKVTKLGRYYYNSIILTADEWDIVNDIKNTLDTMDEKELFFICIVDIVVYDVLKKFGVDGLITQKSKIVSAISSLSQEYTDENFDAALKFIRKIKGDI